MIIEKNEINKICLYYNHGGDGSKERPFYPKGYGAICELKKEIFSSDKNGKITPDCYKCVKDLETLMRVII